MQPRTTSTPEALPAAPSRAPAATNTPQSTATAVPPTLIPTETPVKILFQEQFDDEITCFKVKSLEPDVTLGVENGEYHVRVEGESGFSTRCIGGYHDFVLDFDVRLEEGGPHSVIGLLFRLYVGSSYNVYVTGGNHFCLDFYDSGADSYHGLAGCWEPLPSRLDLKDSLHIRVVAAQDRMAVYLDDAFVAIASDPSLRYGTFGFFVANTGPGATEAVFDNVVIRELRTEDTDVFRDSQTGY